MRAAVQGFFDSATHTVSYIVSDPATGMAAVIDPVLDYEPHAARTSTGSVERLLDHLAGQHLTLAWILETHAHADHLSGAHELRARTGAPVVIGEHIRTVQQTFAPLFEADDVVPDGRAFDRLVADGERLALGGLEIETLHTPGHTPACVSYRIGDAVFVGDTLFMPDYGTARADFPGGDAATLWRSIRRLLDLPPQTRVFVGHDYPPRGRAEPAWETTVAQQRAENLHVRHGVSESGFVTLRKARDATLAAPALILPSLQVNIRAGALPPAGPSGRPMLRLPLNAI